MWKKIGAVGATSTDNKSSRSKDQNAYQPFSQMSKLRVNESQIYFQSNQYFCPNYLNKKKGADGKCLSQSRIMTNKQLQHVKSYKQISMDYQQSTLKKKGFNQDQVQQMKNRLTQQLLEDLNNSGQKQYNQKHPYGQDQLRDTESTEMICSETSLENDMRKLKQCKSTPQLNMIQIASIIEQIPLDKKIQTQKNLNSLKKQHFEIKQSVKNQLGQFKKSFSSMQVQIKNKISKAIQDNNKIHQQRSMKQIELNNKNKSLDFKQIQNETKNFGDKLKKINQKKAQLMSKYMSLRVK